jgi:hypothetical protein
MDTPSPPPDEEPSSSVLEQVVIGPLVLGVGLLLGAGMAALVDHLFNLESSHGSR